MLRPPFSPTPPSLRLFVPGPVVCSIWEIYGGSINGFYRQLLERVEQGPAVGGPSLRLTAKTLKYYGRTYIKIVLGASSAASLLLTREPETGQRTAAVCSCRLCRDKRPQPSRSSPCHASMRLSLGRKHGCRRSCLEGRTGCVGP